MKSTGITFVLTAIAIVTFAMGYETIAPGDQPPAGAMTTKQQDRQAILAMAGCFNVTFDFHETIALAEDYTFAKPKIAKAVEWVQVVEDTENRIVLQHILLAGDQVIKHWRQDWAYEDTTVLVNVKPGVWETQTLNAAAVKGTWTQHVYQTDDSPRYGSVGKWVHEENMSHWESQWTNRPLPRREYTTREDYHLLKARNRHTITPSGWVHEQDNYKVVLDEAGNGQKVLCREVGKNTYERIDDVHGQAAVTWWKANERFWADVRVVWEDVLGVDSRIELNDKHTGRTLRRELNRISRQSMDDERYDVAATRKAIAQAIASFRLDLGDRHRSAGGETQPAAAR